MLSAYKDIPVVALLSPGSDQIARVHSSVREDKIARDGTTVPYSMYPLDWEGKEGGW